MAKVWRYTKKGNFDQSGSQTEFLVYDLNDDSIFLWFLLSEHVLTGKNETCFDHRSIRTARIGNEHEYKVAAKLLWPRNDIQFNAIRNVDFPKGCYIDQAELNPVKKDVYFNQAGYYNSRQYLSAPICRWELPYPSCKLILDVIKL